MDERANELDYSVLHAPFDNVVWDKLWVTARIDFASLKQGGYYVYFSRKDYDRYQKHLLSSQVRRALKLAKPLARIEVEQMLWGS